MSHDSASIAHRAARLLSLTGNVAMVTGAGSGIGRGIAVLLAEMGASIAVLDIDDARGSSTAAEIQAQNGHALAVKCDVRSASDCRRAVETTIQKWGKIDVLCNCAGIAIRKNIVDLTEE